ncbi:uncharacterized protein ATNIH1004_011373 [Aspergillus tanneri]|uniref:Uncharacterized protein n=1 Tax=Aspergillus tanneri TaxID=1220188 RepID=A0A5M9MD27_9EURO|nr:uncharacterized protein ATNIH1004_011373 [Aspergillus tanneri]KAA8642429.1 hypothetical protein ATNIH1004_011373 [Aspergillus tanneri]
MSRGIFFLFKHLVQVLNGFLTLPETSVTTVEEEEKEAANEEKVAEFLDDLDPISDNEEEDVAPIQEQPTTQGLSERAAGKRRRSVASEAEIEAQEGVQSDNETDIPLPEQLETQQRVSGRNRKRSRCEDDDSIHY